MADRKKTPNMSELLTGKANTERTHKEHIENTERTRFESYQKTELETFSVRLSPGDKQRLEDYFQSRGLKLSQGIRMILKEYMGREGV